MTLSAILTFLPTLLQLAGKAREEGESIVGSIRKVLAENNIEADNLQLDANAAEYIERIVRAKQDAGLLDPPTASTE